MVVAVARSVVGSYLMKGGRKMPLVVALEERACIQPASPLAFSGVEAHCSEKSIPSIYKVESGFTRIPCTRALHMAIVFPDSTAYTPMVEIRVQMHELFLGQGQSVGLPWIGRQSRYY